MSFTFAFIFRRKFLHRRATDYVQFNYNEDTTILVSSRSVRASRTGQIQLSMRVLVYCSVA